MNTSSVTDLLQTLSDEKAFAMDNSSVTDLLQTLSDEKAILHIPAFIFIGLLMFTGFIGNAFVCYFYGCKAKENPTSCFIVGLAVLDLLNCTITMPMEIVDIRFFYMFPNATVCKVLRTAAVIFTMSSAFILIAIATERYRRICHPFEKQITVFQAKLVCVVSTVISIAISWPALLFFSVVPVDVPINASYIIHGYDCTTIKSESMRIHLLLFCALHIVLFVSATVVIIVLYVLVYRQLSRGKKFRQKCTNQLERSAEHQDLLNRQGKDTATSLSSVTCEENNYAEMKKNIHKEMPYTETTFNTANYTFCVNLNCTNLVEAKALHDEETEFADEYKKQDVITLHEHDLISTDISDSVESVDEKARKCVIQNVNKPRLLSPTKQKKSRDATADKCTTIMLLITVIFIVSFLPYLGLAVWQSFSLDYLVNQITDWQLVLYIIGVHSYFLNSASNPFIYGFFNPQFRKYIVSVFVSAFRCRKDRKTLRQVIQNIRNTHALKCRGT
ncbi:hypothetical protein ACJMK2_000384 [Sinanodonta woodiana]|uniref:G-protein coupled receptors family 1 profile domain-containing protein n=1 Tax=Sinanodonta woodiana TaxID=1069815 RepID=A0ABD3XPK3_SINWO